MVGASTLTYTLWPARAPTVVTRPERTVGVAAESKDGYDVFQEAGKTLPKNMGKLCSLACQTGRRTDAPEALRSTALKSICSACRMRMTSPHSPRKKASTRGTLTEAKYSSSYSRLDIMVGFRDFAPQQQCGPGHSAADGVLSAGKDLEAATLQEKGRHYRTTSDHSMAEGSRGLPLPPPPAKGDEAGETFCVRVKRKRTQRRFLIDKVGCLF